MPPYRKRYFYKQANDQKMQYEQDITVWEKEIAELKKQKRLEQQEKVEQEEIERLRLENEARQKSSRKDGVQFTEDDLEKVDLKTDDDIQNEKIDLIRTNALKTDENVDPNNRGYSEYYVSNT